MSSYKDKGSHLKPIFAAYGTATAGGAGDNVSVTGASIDTQDYNSGKISLGYQTTLTGGEDLKFGIKYQESDDNSTWGSENVLVTSEAMSGATGADYGGAHGTALQLSDKSRYIRFNITPNLTAGSTDTVAWLAQLIEAGGDTGLVSDD